MEGRLAGESKSLWVRREAAGGDDDLVVVAVVAEAVHQIPP